MVSLKLRIIVGIAVFIFGYFAVTNSTVLYNSSVFQTASAYSSESKSTYYLRADAPAPPRIEARAYIVADLLTGDVLIQKAPDKAFPIASVTKLTTAVVALNNKLEDTELLYPLLLESSNQTAEKITKFFGRRTFIQDMNNFAVSLGMTHTRYSDPSGISPKNVSSASDLLKLTQYIYKNTPELFDLTIVPNKDTDKNSWQNNNLFVQERHPNYIGGKSGYTPEAKGTLVSVFALPLAGDTLRPVVVILLGTDSKMGVKYEVAQSIIDYILTNVYFK
mgnify:FL=1